MMMNPEAEYRQHQQRHQALMQAVRIDRLMHDADAERDQLPKRFLLLLSDVMIDGGTRLKDYVRNTTGPGSLTGPDAHLELIRKL